MVAGLQPKLQPCLSRQLHFCAEQHVACGVSALDLPEVDNITGFDARRSWPAMFHAYAANGSIDQARTDHRKSA
jgi:hypothetical protein